MIIAGFSAVLFFLSTLFSCSTVFCLFFSFFYKTSFFLRGRVQRRMESGRVGLYYTRREGIEKDREWEGWTRLYQEGGTVYKRAVIGCGCLVVIYHFHIKCIWRHGVTRVQLSKPSNTKKFKLFYLNQGEFIFTFNIRI